MAALEDEVPQVVVSDIRMPGESGLELLQQAKVRHPSLPVIIMTAYSDLESAVTAFQGGAYEYLPKPFDVDHAVELIRRAMDESVRRTARERSMNPCRKFSVRRRPCRKYFVQSDGCRSHTLPC